MNADDLRARQGPLKADYRETPEHARVTSRAEGTLAHDDIACAVTGWNTTVEAGLHPSTGGDGSQACSADLLLQALVACAGVTLKSVATAMGVTLHDARITAEGDWDARGTLGVDRQAPIGLTDVRLRFQLDTDADEATVNRLIALAERYCVIYQTLSHPPRLSVERADH